MLKQEFIEDTFWKNGLVKIYSNSNYYVVNKDGVKYESVVAPKDLVQSGERVYTETDEIIPTDTSAIEEQIATIKAELATYDYIGVKIAMGVATKEEYADKIAYTETLRAKINQLQENGDK